jgi:hypothetical protein
VDDKAPCVMQLQDESSRKYREWRVERTNPEGH